MSRASKFLKNKKSIIIWILILAFTLFFEGLFLYDNHQMGLRSGLPDENKDNIPISKGTVVEQEFLADGSTLDGIILDAGKIEAVVQEQPDTVQVTLTEEDSGKVLKTWMIDKFTSTDEYVQLYLDQRMTDAAGTRLKLRIEGLNESGLYLPQTNGTSNGAVSLTVDGKKMKAKSVCYAQVYERVNTNFVFGVTALFTVIAFALLYILLRTKPGKRTEWAFACLYLLIGLFDMATVPMYKVADEPSHLFRSYQIAQGRFIAPTNEDGAAGGELPSVFLETKAINNMYEKFYDVERMTGEINPEDKTFVAFENTAQYAPATYLPQAIGVRIADFFSNRVLTLAYAGRIANFLVCGIILFFAIKAAPVGKNLIMLISLIPMNMYQTVSLSADSFAYVLCVSMVVFALYWCFGTERVMNRKDLALLFILVILLAQSKIIYIAFCLLLFMIPKERFGSRKRYRIIVALAVLIGVGLLAGWFYIIRGYVYHPRMGTGAGAQIRYVLHHPWAVLLAFVRTINKRANEWILMGLGINLGWLTIYTSPFLLLLYGVMVLHFIFLDNDLAPIARRGFSTRHRWALGLTAVLILLLLMASEYVQWTLVGDANIQGVQGRYLLPMCLPFMLAVKPNIKTINNEGIRANYSYPAILGLNLAVLCIAFAQAI